MPFDDPGKAHDELDELTNMQPNELESWLESDQFDAYADAKSGGEPVREPAEDMLRLMETPKSEWEDTDDGFNEVEEANQAISFIERMRGNESGEPIPGSDPELSKRDASLINWGFDPNEDRADFPGDRRL